MAIFSKLKPLTAMFAIAMILLLSAKADGQVMTVQSATINAVAQIEQADGKPGKRLESKISTRISQALNIQNQQIESCLAKFEQNANCPQEEIVRTYELMWQAISNTNTENLENLNLLCWHLLQELAVPSQINQGNHNTCALTALQSYLSIKHPSLLCKVVLDAWSGKFVLADGRMIKLENSNLVPDRESRFFRPGEHYRSYAGQIFQLAAANAYWQSQTKDPRDIKVPTGSIRYVQDYTHMNNKRNDTGERLLIFWADNIVEQIVADDSVYPVSSPCFTLEAINQTYQLITNLDDAPLLLAHKSKRCHNPVLSFSNEASLRRMLVQLKTNNQLPAIISLNMNSQMLAPSKSLMVAKDNKLVYALPQNSGAHQWHVLCINDIDENNDGIAIDNFWGPAADHLEEKLSLHELWSSSLSQPQNKAQLGSLH